MIYFERVAESREEKKRERALASTDYHNNQEPKASSGSPTWVSVAQAPGPYSTGFLRALVESKVRSAPQEDAWPTKPQCQLHKIVLLHLSLAC